MTQLLKNTRLGEHLPLTNGTEGQIMAITSGVPAWTTGSVAGAGTSNPVMNGAAAAGSATTWSCSDHVHPSDTAKATAWTSTPVGSLSGAGTTRADATTITAWNTANSFSTVSSSTGAVLPASAANNWAIVVNGGANALKLYAAGSETINGTAGSTGVSIPAGKSAMLVVPVAGTIFAVISA